MGKQTIVDLDQPAELTVELAAGSDVRYFAVVGLQQLRKRIHFRLFAGARLRSYTVACGCGNDAIQLDYIIEHVGRATTAYTLVKGVFTGSAHAEVFGLIKVMSTGVGTDSFLEQRVLLLSESARANLQPKLEIDANDLKASHAAAVGQLDPLQLFYCQSRGIPLPMARRLIVQAFLNDALSQLPDAALRASVGESLHQKLAIQ